MSVNNAYRTQMQSYANRAAAALNMPADVILAQWALESGNGSSSLAKQHNNHGGIKYTSNSKTARKISGSPFADYASVNDFVTDYIRVLSLSYYKDVRAAGSVEDTIKALGASPYDAGHYTLSGVQGGAVANILGISPGKLQAPAQPKVCPTCHRPL